MSYTRKCNANNCEAMLEWNEDQEFYEDSLFPGQKHDHKKFREAASKRTEVSQEKSMPAGTNIEGTECKKCKANGFPNEIIFFNNEVKGNKTGRVIPLEHAEKVNGEWVFHEHKNQNGQKPAQESGNKQENAPVREEREYEPPINQDSLNELIRSFTFELRQMNRWFSDIRPELETAIGYINAQSIKRANEKA